MVVLGISVFALATSPLLLVAIAYWVRAARRLSLTREIGGYLAINRFVNPEATEGLTTRNAYAALVVVGLPLTWVAAPLSAIFWIVGCSAVTVGLRASSKTRLG